MKVKIYSKAEIELENKRIDEHIRTMIAEDHRSSGGHSLDSCNNY